MIKKYCRCGLSISWSFRRIVGYSFLTVLFLTTAILLVHSDSSDKQTGKRNRETSKHDPLHENPHGDIPPLSTNGTSLLWMKTKFPYFGTGFSTFTFSMSRLISSLHIEGELDIFTGEDPLLMHFAGEKWNSSVNFIPALGEEDPSLVLSRLMNREMYKYIICFGECDLFLEKMYIKRTLFIQSSIRSVDTKEVLKKGGLVAYVDNSSYEKDANRPKKPIIIPPMLWFSASKEGRDVPKMNVTSSICYFGTESRHSVHSNVVNGFIRARKQDPEILGKYNLIIISSWVQNGSRSVFADGIHRRYFRNRHDSVSFMRDKCTFGVTGVLRDSGVSMYVIEMAATGLPVIITSKVEYKRMFGESYGLFFDGSEESFAKVVLDEAEKIKATPKYYTELSDYVLEVSRRYTIDNVLEDVSDDLMKWFKPI